MFLCPEKMVFAIATVAVIRIFENVKTEEILQHPKLKPEDLQSFKDNSTKVVQTAVSSNINPPNSIQSEPHDIFSVIAAPNLNSKESSQNPCVCGVFLTSQFVPGSSAQPSGNPVLTHEHDEPFSCNSGGTKQCTNKCLDVLVKHLSNSPTIICGSIDRDCFKERAYLWIKNCHNLWSNTNMSAGREYCCKDGIPYKCPLVS